MYLYAKKIKCKGECKVQSPSTLYLSSPKLLTKHLPLSLIIQRSPKLLSSPTVLKNTQLLNYLKKSAVENISIPESREEEKQPADFIISEIPESLTKDRKAQTTEPFLPEDYMKSPSDTEVVRIKSGSSRKNSSVQSKSKPTLMKSATIELAVCQCGNVCNKEHMSCDKCSEDCKPVEQSGNLYLKRPDKSLVRYWIRLINKELFCTHTQSYV